MSRSLDPDLALAAVLRRMREERGITREMLAFEAGITTGSLARIELAQASPGWLTVSRIAQALGISLVELVIEVEAEEPRVERLSSSPGRRG